MTTRLLTLDAMRGLAALLVVIYHLEDTVEWAPSAYLAVDFFFLMSGVVIAASYDSKLLQGMSFKTFLLERLIRLYPLFLLGLVIGFARRVGQISIHHPDQMSWPDLIVGSLVNLFMVPTPIAGHGLFPANSPSWSLFFELVVNVLYATALVRARKRVVIALAGGCAVLLAVCVVWYGSATGGVDWRSFDMGLLRAVFAFTVGVVMSRIIDRRRPSQSWAFLIPCVALLILLISEPAFEWRVAYDLTCIFVLFPALAWFGSALNPPPRLQAPATLLGELSYPLYVLHYALLFMTSFVARRLNVPALIWIPAFLVGLVALSYGLVRWYDTPIRRYLRTSLIPARSWRTVAQGA
ncbi:acyltransferase [soil metagenome]